MQQIEVDGVTTFWEDGPAPFTGALVFGVGARHETFRTVEVTHLVEHLVMSTMPRWHLDMNAHVDVDTTVFHATGRPEEVVDFLHRVCRALTDLPLDRLSREAGVLAAEEGTSAHPSLCFAVSVRSGPVGPGVLAARGAGVRQVTERHVRDHAARWFVRDNAVLVLTGPPPEGLRLLLPRGPRPAETPWWRGPVELPALVAGDVRHPTLSMLLPRAMTTGSLTRILADRVEDEVRHGKGLAYEIGTDSCRLDDHTQLSAIYTDGAEENAEAIAHAIWGALRDLADHGPTEAEVAHDRAGFAGYLDDPRATYDWLEGVAYRYLYGKHLYGTEPVTREAALAEYAELTPGKVQQWAKEALATVVVGVPEPLKKPLDGVPDRSDWEPPDHPGLPGERFTRKTLRWSPLDLAVTAGEAGVVQTAQGSRVGATWEQVVGVAAAPGLRSLMFSDGSTVNLWHRDLKNADRLFALVDQRAGDLLYESTKEEILGGSEPSMRR